MSRSGRPQPGVAGSARRGTRPRDVVAALAAVACGGCAGLGDLPPFHEVESDLPGGVVEERGAFGLVETRRWPGGDREAAIRPLVVERTGPDAPLVRSFLPPIASHTESALRRRTRVWPVFSLDSVGTDEERARDADDLDGFLLPVLGWGREPGQGRWWMAFPVAGHLEQKLLTEEIDFALFPLWAGVRDGGWRSTHLLFPLIAWGDGEGRSHRRFLPFWSQTDGPHASRRTALWPVVHWNVEERGDRVFDGWFVFPLYGRRASRDGSYSERTVLWPFFQWSEDERTGDRWRGLPWPFHKRAELPSSQTTSTWWWPLWGDFHGPKEDSSFWLWPIGWQGEFREEARTSRRFFVVPLWMERESGPADAPPDRREIRSWPFFSYERTALGLETVRVPELIPFFGWRSGETAWADLVALVRWRADATGRAAWDGPLGGIVRWRRDADGASRLTLLWWLTIPTGGGS